MAEQNIRVHFFSHRAALLGMLLMVAVVGLASILWCVKNPASGGFGQDGRFYGPVAQTLDAGSLDAYHFSRVLPSFAVHAGLVALRQPMDVAHIVVGFGVLDLLALLTACLLYALVAEELAMSLSAFWLGFLALFANFTMLKFVWYTPVMTDAVAAALAMGMLLCYLKKRPVLLLLVTLLGAFTWPILIYAGCFLLVFPCKPVEEEKTAAPRWMAAGFALFVLAVTAYSFLWFRQTAYGTRMTPPVVQISVALLLGLPVLYKAVEVLLDGITLRSVWRAFAPYWALGAAALWIAVKIPVWLWANPALYAVSASTTIRKSSILGFLYPLGFLASHPTLLGPAVLLLYLFWRPYGRIVRRYGFGLVLVVWMGLLTALTPESRQSLASYVMMTPFIGLLVEELALPARFVGLLALLALPMSRVWVNIIEKPESGTATALTAQNALSHLDSLRNQGPMMTPHTYLVKAAVVLGAMAVLWVALKWMRRREPGIGEPA